MARNGSGTYNRAVAPYVAGTTIAAATVNSEMEDIATALTESMARDGQAPATANIPMGGFRLTGLGDAIVNTDAAALGQVMAKAGDTATGALGVIAGTAAAPGVFVSDDTNTGLFQPAADTLAISVGGVEVARFGANGFVRLANGTAAAPAFSFSGDTNTGIFSPAADALSVTVGGDRLVDFFQSSSLLNNKIGDAEANHWIRLNDASATVFRSCQYGAMNENTVNVVSMRPVLNTDGSANLEIYATPPGARTSDRRVLRVGIPGSGAITMNGGLNVSDGLDVSGNLRFDSGYGSVAQAYGCRAWVNFNGTGTVAIRASGNVSSITDNGTGDYTVNFTTAMPDANYCAVMTVGDGSASGTTSRVAYTATYNVGSLRFGCSDNNSNTNVDSQQVNVAIFR
jgi:hypothetical protein